MVNGIKSCRKKNECIINLRALAIILVVFGHSIILYSSSWNLFSTDISVACLDYVKKIIDIIQMPLFFSISGFLFYYTYKKINIHKLIVNKMKRLIIPFIGFALFWLLPIRLMVKYPGYEGSIIKTILVKILYGRDNGHLWFLPTLFICFLALYVVLTFEEKIKISEPIKELINIFLFVLIYFVYRFGFQPYIYNFSQNLIWFYFGYLINSNMEILTKVRRKNIWGVILIFVSIIFIVMSISNHSNILTFISKSIVLLTLYVIIPEKSGRLIQFVDKNSFGIYLIHSPLVYITYSYIPNCDPYIIILINFVVFGCIACLLTELIRRSKLKIFIGE